MPIASTRSSTTRLVGERGRPSRPVDRRSARPTTVRRDRSSCPLVERVGRVATKHERCSFPGLSRPRLTPPRVPPPGDATKRRGGRPTYRGRVKHALFVAPFGELSDPTAMVDVAERGRGARLGRRVPLGPRASGRRATSSATHGSRSRRSPRRRTRIAIGPMVTPITRRRPQRLARESRRRRPPLARSADRRARARASTAAAS